MNMFITPFFILIGILFLCLTIFESSMNRYFLFLLYLVGYFGAVIILARSVLSEFTDDLLDMAIKYKLSPQSVKKKTIAKNYLLIALYSMVISYVCATGFKEARKTLMTQVKAVGDSINAK